MPDNNKEGFPKQIESRVRMLVDDSKEAVSKARHLSKNQKRSYSSSNQTDDETIRKQLEERRKRLLGEISFAEETTEVSTDVNDDEDDNAPTIWRFFRNVFIRPHKKDL